MSASANDCITVYAVGDIMMGTTYPEEVLPPNDGSGIFDNVRGELSGGDIVFGNLEGPLLDGGKTEKCRDSLPGHCYAFRMPTRYGGHLREGGFTVLSIANNHSSDFETQGIESTIRTLAALGIESAGGESIAHLEIKGRRIAIAGFSFSSSLYSFSILDITAAQERVRQLKASHDLVIVSFHGGAEGSNALHVPNRNETFLGEDRGNVSEFARSVIDAGADMVIGHGPHVLRAIEVYKGKLVAYSLGNFLTYGMFNIKGPNGVSVILKAKLDARTGDLIEGEMVPIKLAKRGIPERDPRKEAVSLIRKLSREDMGAPNSLIAESGRIKVAVDTAELKATGDPRAGTGR